MKIPTSLLATEIDEFTDGGEARKRLFHADGKKFMTELAAALGITGACDIRSNKAGCGSGDITLHGDHIYVTLSGDGRKGPELLYRGCRSRKDYSGFGNNFITMQHLFDFEYEEERFIERCREMMASAAKTAAHA